MTQPGLTPEDVQGLTRLANAVIPADERDGGAEAVDAGPRLVAAIADGVNAAVYIEGLRAARELAREMFGDPIAALQPAEIHGLLLRLRERAPAFFKQLRLDVATMYLSDPAVWARIGFPGPSIATGGYPDFDRPQGNRQE
jgi:Gluconate 2-dehydrogenase subunit 3